MRKLLAQEDIKRDGALKITQAAENSEREATCRCTADPCSCDSGHACIIQQSNPLDIVNQAQFTAIDVEINIPSPVQI